MFMFSLFSLSSQFHLFSRWGSELDGWSIFWFGFVLCCCWEEEWRPSPLCAIFSGLQVPGTWQPLQVSLLCAFVFFASFSLDQNGELLLAMRMYKLLQQIHVFAVLSFKILFFSCISTKTEDPDYFHPNVFFCQKVIISVSQIVSTRCTLMLCHSQFKTDACLKRTLLVATFHILARIIFQHLSLL